MNDCISFDDVVNWIGSDHQNKAIEYIVEIANGDYTPQQLKKDIQALKE